MRNAFVRGLMTLAKQHEELFLITGDLGFGVLTEFQNTYPEKYMNAGIAEQAMTGVAAGMAMEGRVVFTYSIGNFPTLRAVEQIRNDCAYHRANVKIVCVGGGFVYGSLGMSHHATEDVAVLRALPDVTVFSPGDAYETEAIIPVLYETPGTCYLRLGRGGDPLAHEKPIDGYQLGQALTISEGTDGAVFASGAILPEAHKAVKALKAKGINIALYSFPTVKPIDTALITRVAQTVPFIVTCEEHNIVGGFGSAVTEIVAAIGGQRATVERIGIRDQYSAVVGTQDYLRMEYGLDSAHIIARIKALKERQHG